MIVRTMAVSACMAMLGCTPDPYPKYHADQKIRAERFDACMAALPAGPQRITGGNDWNEVVDACESAAYYQSLVCVANCPGENE